MHQATPLVTRPHIILLDINLPEMDGYEVIARLRSDPATAAIPVLAVTANAMPGDAARAYDPHPGTSLNPHRDTAGPSLETLHLRVQLAFQGSSTHPTQRP